MGDAEAKRKRLAIAKLETARAGVRYIAIFELSLIVLIKVYSGSSHEFRWIQCCMKASGFQTNSVMV